MLAASGAIAAEQNPPVPVWTGLQEIRLFTPVELAGSAPTYSWQYYAYGGPYSYFDGTSGTFAATGGVVGSFIGESEYLYFNIIADPGSITLDYSVTNRAPGAWSPSALSLPPTIYNGIAFDLLSGPEITSVTIDPVTNMIGFDASRISFTATQIQVDWVELPFDNGTVVKLNVSTEVAVEVDIKPGSFPNIVNLRALGVVPVAILGSAGFDVTTLDVTTLRFGPAEVAPFHDLFDPATYQDHLEDVNLDGYVDLMTHYETRATGIDCDTTEVALIGRTLSGQSVRGTDSIEPIGCGYPVRPVESNEPIREIRRGTTVGIAPR
jgi:hypothetical protein